MSEVVWATPIPNPETDYISAKKGFPSWKKHNPHLDDRPLH